MCRACDAHAIQKATEVIVYKQRIVRRWNGAKEREKEWESESATHTTKDARDLLYFGWCRCFFYIRFAQVERGICGLCSIISPPIEISTEQCALTMYWSVAWLVYTRSLLFWARKSIVSLKKERNSEHFSLKSDFFVNFDSLATNTTFSWESRDLAGCFRRISKRIWIFGKKEKNVSSL